MLSQNTRRKFGGSVRFPLVPTRDGCLKINLGMQGAYLANVANNATAGGLPEKEYSYVTAVRKRPHTESLLQQARNKICFASMMECGNRELVLFRKLKNI
jgi:hypothetical protein